MRDYVEGYCRDLEAKIEQNQAEMRRTVDATQVAIDKSSAQLAQLATQLNEFRPARSKDVAIGHT